MNMPEEIRETLRDVLCAAIADYYEGEESLERLDAALAWLGAQPEAPEPGERWEPVAVGAKYDVAGTVGRRVLYRMDDDALAVLTVEDNTVESAEMLQLPPDLRLCRRVEVSE